MKKFLRKWKSIVKKLMYELDKSGEWLFDDYPIEEKTKKKVGTK